MRSSTVSIPTDSRMTSGPAPAAIRSLVGQLPVRGRRGMEDQAPGVAHVGQVGPQLDALDDPDARLEAAADAEREDGARPERQVAGGQCVGRAGRQARVRHPGDRRVAVQELGDATGIRDVALHAQRQRLDPGQDVERIGRRQGRPEVAQGDGPRLHRETEVAEGLDEVKPVVGRVRAGQERELAARLPVEPAGLARRSRPSTCRGRTGTWSASGRRYRRPTRTAGTGTGVARVLSTTSGIDARVRDRRPAPRCRRRRRPGWRAISTKTALVRSPIAARDRRRVRGIDEGGRPAEARRTCGASWVSDPPYSCRAATT